MEINNSKGFEEVIVQRGSTFEQFQQILNRISKLVKGGEFVNDFDSYYFIFDWKGQQLVLHLSNSQEITLYPYHTNTYSKADGEALHEVAKLLSGDKSTDLPNFTD